MKGKLTQRQKLLNLLAGEPLWCPGCGGRTSRKYITFLCESVSCAESRTWSGKGWVYVPRSKS